MFWLSVFDGADTCSVEIELQRMELTGYHTEYEMSWLNDKVSIDPSHRYRIFAEEHSENCTSVRIKRNLLRDRLFSF